jgi:hypothetical protein
MSRTVMAVVLMMAVMRMFPYKLVLEIGSCKCKSANSQKKYH